MKFYSIKPEELNELFNYITDENPDFPSPSDACLIDVFQQMPFTERKNFLDNLTKERKLHK